ncbi:MAG: RluA family pseudouridine synthase [Opitutales bacterium]|jgi:tRNA pseudouridine32 synthase / 23S rRNA pseudouridine746 synthase|nr:RluA family pseudouridine synthase [Opitutales bacterium]MBT5169922.1 RluA family pseudouridine synthase [Opitutales bacterium]MBT5816467.1 RluA family pseudouridine synthase [Opitutales bacterium]MBT6380805.1 RluA family pseudouridine synthase [Opitutales bacterium]MBT6767360.1 RluA family pseudouridine synthase [Opitutales bacterium]
MSHNRTSTNEDDFIAPVCHDEIELLYQDEHILLINKPSGLLSLSGKNPPNLDSVHYRLVKDFPSARMIHRLDLGTSGIMVLALSKTANTHLCEQFTNRTVSKIYTALLDGQLDQEQGIIDIPMIKDEENFPYQKVCYVTGKSSQSAYQVLEYLPEHDASRVKFTPITGRTHQLRVHSHEIGHSILGCDLYASDTVGAKADRLMLHALTLSFDHPASGERINAECPCPF